MLYLVSSAYSERLQSCSQKAPRHSPHLFQVPHFVSAHKAVFNAKTAKHGPSHHLPRDPSRAPYPFAPDPQILIMGLYAHEGAFWHSSWNKLDVLVTICSVIACFVSPTHQGDQVKSLRSFRLLRALRPLRMVRCALGGADAGGLRSLIFVAPT